MTEHHSLAVVATAVPRGVVETAIAEKLHAMVVLGSKNSGMRGFFDVYVLAKHGTFAGGRLAAAVSAT